MKIFSDYLKEDYGLKLFQNDDKFFDKMYNFLKKFQNKYYYQTEWVGDKNSPNPEIQLNFFDKYNIVKLNLIIDFKKQIINLNFDNIINNINNINKILNGISFVNKNITLFLKELKKLS